MKQLEDDFYYPSDDLEYLYHPIVDDEGNLISYQDFIEKYQL
ncbi:hypothetical protein [Cyanobacterium aponinum]|uniref:Uncharacterized protein n=1 Tax=Cyanobacterium aponinum (strain PCC 10605) TaxID=755178 RepID=K9Z6D2_CYAAP|nr:hypothetical protein [Cyanobacterium aponinum]AFZ54736.1 hypothetical protein Cyan10605_2662 [Cyanobacterium aponinum PCC 10605]